MMFVDYNFEVMQMGRAWYRMLQLSVNQWSGYYTRLPACEIFNSKNGDNISKWSPNTTDSIQNVNAWGCMPKNA